MSDAPGWNALHLLAGLAGAVVGAAAGSAAFFWIAQQGFHALVVPGAAMGLGAGLAAWRRCVPLAVVCGAAALPLALYCEWKAFPFSADQSLGYFAAHLDELRPLTWILAVVGAALAAYLALGFVRRA